MSGQGLAGRKSECQISQGENSVIYAAGEGRLKDITDMYPLETGEGLHSFAVFPERQHTQADNAQTVCDSRALTYIFCSKQPPKTNHSLAAIGPEGFLANDSHLPNLNTN